jgi:hypothetical protein
MSTTNMLTTISLQLYSQATPRVFFDTTTSQRPYGSPGTKYLRTLPTTSSTTLHSSLELMALVTKI